MSRTARLLLALLLAYTGALLAAAWWRPADEALLYFRDIEGPVRFLSVNTTVSVFLLWGAALLCTVAAAEGGQGSGFLAAQAILFFLFGLDDRFHVHEDLGPALGVPDVLPLLLLGVLELLLLLGPGRPFLARTADRLLLAATAAAAGARAFMDLMASSPSPVYVAVEDLLKTWGGACLLAFAWRILHRRLRPHSGAAAGPAGSRDGVNRR